MKDETKLASLDQQEVDSRMAKVKETFDRMEGEMDDFRDRLGSVILDAINEDDNSTWEIGRSLTRELRYASVLQYDMADKVLIAVTGYSIESLLNKIKEEREEEENE